MVKSVLGWKILKAQSQMEMLKNTILKTKWDQQA